MANQETKLDRQIRRLVEEGFTHAQAVEQMGLVVRQLNQMQGPEASGNDSQA